MRDLDSIVSAIKQSVSAVEVGRALGLNIDRHGRCTCPAHGGTNPNCKLWPDDRGWYCYKCHQGGDTVSLVQTVNQCSFWKAVEWLNSVFNLALPLDRPMDKNTAEAAQRARKRKQEEREQKQAIERMEFDLYCITGQIVNSLESDIERYSPKRAYEPWDKRFVDAVRLLPEAREVADRLAVEVIGVKRNDC